MLRITFTLLLGLALGVPLLPALQVEPPATEARAMLDGQELNMNHPAVRRVADRLLCQCGGCTGTVHTCPHGINCSMRSYMLRTIQNGLAEGKTEDQVVASMLQEYGPRILAEPPREGFAWLGWIMPYVALLLGVGGVAIVLWRWKAGSEGDQEEPEKTPEAAAQTSEPLKIETAVLVEKYRSEIDRELARD
jgi:cytochrome c-type biogenesis protein CcmH